MNISLYTTLNTLFMIYKHQQEINFAGMKKSPVLEFHIISSETQLQYVTLFGKG